MRDLPSSECCAEIDEVSAHPQTNPTPSGTLRKPVWHAHQNAAVAELREQRLQPMSDADAALVGYS